MINKTRLENRLMRLKRERENEIDRHEVVDDMAMNASISGRINRLTVMIESVEDALRLEVAPVEQKLQVPAKVSFEKVEKKDNKRVASVRQFGDLVVPKPKKKKEVKTHAGYVRPTKK